MNVFGDVMTEVQVELSNFVLSQPSVASEFRIAMNSSEDHQSKLLHEVVEHCMTAMPIASANRVNIPLTLLAAFAEKCNHPVLMEEIKRYNGEAIDDATNG